MKIFMLTTTGFVLRRNDYREYDRIYTIYTSDFGKISLLVRGAKRIKSKLAPALESFDEVRIDFAKGKVFNHLSGSASLALNKNILKDGQKIELARDCLYLIDRFIKPEETDQQIYSLLKDIFFFIARQEKECFLKLKVYFFWRLVDSLGYRPQLDECALCGARSGIVNQKLWFNITDNILICKECAGAGILIDSETLENLRKIFQSNPEDFLKIELNQQLIAITETAKQIKLSEL